jgi:hypothetical protein
MRRGKGIAAVALAAALAFAGCGGDDEAGTDAAKTETTETAAKTATTRTTATEAKTERAETKTEKRADDLAGATTPDSGSWGNGGKAGGASPSDPSLGVDVEVTPVSPGSKTCRVELSNGQSSRMPCDTARRIFGD